MMSDESENEGAYTDNNYENDVYYKKYKLLLEECAHLQKSNEILVFRIQEVNKIVRRRHKEVKFFKKRLQNNYAEDWNLIPNLDLVKEEEDAKTSPFPFKEQKIKEEKPDEPVAQPAPHPPPAEKPKPAKKPTKRKAGKSERDPNAPKRPSNPFFQYCQEQRQILMEQLNAELKPGEEALTKQELTRQLAIRWKTLSTNDKQAYVDMYERSKEKYAAELSEYNMKK